MVKNNLEKIKKTAQEFFQKMDLGITVDVKSPQDLTVPINLTMPDPQMLIGEEGQTLAEIQRLLKLILKKKAETQEPFYINLDVNGYKRKKTEYLQEMAKSLADEVALTKKEKQLPPMPASERRVIHLELSSRSDVISESIGQEPTRSVIIKPRV